MNTDKRDLIDYALRSKMLSEWHWFQYHFNLYHHGLSHPFAESIIDTCLEIEAHIPGFARDMINNLASICGKEKYMPHYEQLMQRLSEILIISQVTKFNWPEPATFIYEPKAKGSKKNPEIMVTYGNNKIGIEVKAPSIIEHKNKRNINKVQLSTRSQALKDYSDKHFSKEGITLPRDNPVKDFLKSSDEKFKSFKSEYGDNFTGILVIVWDDFIFEPITALLSPNSGLFTKNSFAKNKDGKIPTFSNVDGVIVVRHLHQFQRSAGDQPLLDECNHALDYGSKVTYPPKAFIQNPDTKKVDNNILECFQAYDDLESMGAEYIPSDIIFWN